MDDIAAQTQLALRRLAKSVAVITTRWNGKRLAMSATEVEGLSLDPPSVLICIAVNASLAEPLIGGARFAINLLSSAQAPHSSRCVAPWQGEERFALGRWSDDPERPPLLEEAQASFICMPDGVTTYGTHHIIVGRIEEVHRAGEIAPLVYADGGYWSLGDPLARQ